jgi:hypothetical protein
MSFERTNNEVIVYQLTTEIKDESMHDNLMHMHDRQVFRLDKYETKVRKSSNIFFIQNVEKDYFIYAVDKVNRKYEISTIHTCNTVYRIHHSHNVVEDKLELKTN